jgi:hypothetical protein
MTRDDAVTIVTMLVHSWPGPAWEAEKLEAYVNAILPLDAAITTRALGRAVNELKFRPSIAELREFIQIERRLSEPDEARFVLPDKPPKPQWVERWERARAAGDRRPFPEQMMALDILARQSPEHYKAYAPPEVPTSEAEHWVQPHEYLEDPSGGGAIVRA